MFPIAGVEMRRIVIIEVHSDDNSEEPTDLRHVLFLRRSRLQQADTSFTVFPPVSRAMAAFTKPSQSLSRG